MSDNNEVQERQEIPSWVNTTIVVIGFVLILISFLAIGLHFYDSKKFPSPSDLETNFLMALGILLLLIAYLPWSKIKFGDFELEKTIQEQAQDYSLEIEKLTQDLMKLKSSSTIDTESVDRKVLDFATFNHYFNNKEEVKDLLIKFLKEWKTYGFTISRVKKWGGEQQGYEPFKDMSTTELRMIADELLREGKVKTRISRGGNVLYQYK